MRRLLASDAILDMSTKEQRELQPPVHGGHTSRSEWPEIQPFLIQQWRRGERLAAHRLQPFEGGSYADMTATFADRSRQPLTGKFAFDCNRVALEHVQISSQAVAK